MKIHSLLHASLQKRVILSILFFVFLAAAASAQGDLLIYPKRLVFDGAKRSQELSLSNSGTDTARYEISVVQIRMKEDGRFETITEPESGQQFADKNFRFFPRHVVLGPHEAQTVKVQLLKYSELGEGEYRSHLYFRAEKEKKALGESEQKVDSSSISVKLTPVYGISIPVIIRAGTSTTEIALSKLTFGMEKDSLPMLKMNLNRDGNMSVYGDLSVDYISADGKEIRVAQVKGLAVYTPNASRQLSVLLNRHPDVDYRRGALHVVFTDASGPVQKLAQQQIYLR